MTKPRKVPKADKVEEPAAAYGAPPLLDSKKGASPDTKTDGQTIPDAEFRRLADKIFAERKELLRKLAE
jgi:hypothetical protein